MVPLSTYPDLLQALSDEMTPKFLATRSTDGIPNVVPCTSMRPAGDVGQPQSPEEEDRLIFGNFLLRKSVGNLDSDPRVGILVITTDLEGWLLQGDFIGWQRAGVYVDRLNNTDLLRYNAYTGVRNAGIIRVRTVLRHFRISKLRVLSDYLLARAGSRSPNQSEQAVRMPMPVRQGFSPVSAVRVLAFLDKVGYPLAVPALSLQPAGEGALVCAPGLFTNILETLTAGDPVAASLLTLDIVSFQAKGRWLGSRQLLGALVGAMSVTSVYAGGPPIPGRQVA